MAHKKKKSGFRMPKEHLIVLGICLVGIIAMRLLANHYSKVGNEYKAAPRITSQEEMDAYRKHEGKIMIEGTFVDEDGRQFLYSSVDTYEEVIEEDKDGKERISYDRVDSTVTTSEHLTVYGVPIDTRSMKFEGWVKLAMSTQLVEYYEISGPEHHGVVAGVMKDGRVQDGTLYFEDGITMEKAGDLLANRSVWPIIGMWVFIALFLFVLLSLVLTNVMDD